MAKKGSHQTRHNRTSKKGKVFPAGRKIPNTIQVKQYLEITKPFNKKMSKADHFPVETAIIVPATEHTTRISDDEFEKRILETKKFLANNFGGYSAIQETGGWFEKTKDNKKILIKEPVVKVVSFAKPKDYLSHRRKLRNFLIKKKKNWKQKAISYEQEGDLFFI